MGVPAFFRWLTKKYPATVVNANEDRQRDADGKRVPVDCTQPNPNFQEFDNLYLDMNGIIHPCTHPEDRPPPKNEDEMFALIFEYIDRIYSIVRPRRVSTDIYTLSNLSCFNSFQQTKEIKQNQSVQKLNYEILEVLYLSSYTWLLTESLQEQK